MDKNVSMHISDRDHMNLTLNIYHCGNQDIREPLEKLADYYVLYYVQEGAGSLTAGSLCSRLAPGCIFAAFPNRGMTVKSDYGTPLNVTWVAFSGYMVEHYLRRGGLTPGSLVVSDDEQHTAETLFEKILNDSRTLPNRYCKISASLYSIFAFLLDHCYNSNAPSNYSLEYYLLKALDFIDIYYNSSISVEQIAEHVGVTRKYLYNIFKKLTDVSPKEYLTYYRVERAAQMLRDGSLTVDSIAAGVGYANQFCFAKEFKKEVGKTPTEYRAYLKQHPDDPYVSPINRIKKEYINV